MGKCLFMRKGNTHTDPGSRLPSGYTELVYIQSTGTQYIDTGIIPTNRVDIAVKFQLTETQSVGGIISAEKTWGTAMYSVDAWACRYNTTYKSSAFVENVDYTVRVIGKNFYINDEMFFEEIDLGQEEVSKLHESANTLKEVLSEFFAEN